MITNFKRITKFGWQGFWRNKGLAAQVVFTMMVVVFIVTFLFLFRQVSLFLITETQKKVDISVYFKSDVSEDRILEVKDQILGFSEGIKSVDYVSKEQAKEVFLEEHQGDNLWMEALEEIEDNPFFASLNISAQTPDQYAYISSFLEDEPFASLIENVSYNKNKRVIDKLFQITTNVERGGLVLIFVFAVLVALITFNTIKLSIFSSKREITTRKLVGASNWFIQGPFIVQGILYSLFSVVIFDIVFFLFLLFLNSQVSSLLLDFNLLNSFKVNAVSLLLIQFSFLLFLGVISSFVAVRKYLKV